MSNRHIFSFLLSGVVLAAGLAVAQEPAPSNYDVKFIGPRLADPIMQHNKEQYVLYGCAYCHGLYLQNRTGNGEATDLLHSRLVGRDEDGTVIAALLKAGIPQTPKLSPMPNFADLSEQQLHAIGNWIHYARQQGKFKELTEQPVGAGNVAAGKTYFDSNCAACHSLQGDFAKATENSAPQLLRTQILQPTSLEWEPNFKVGAISEKMLKGQARHHRMLENYTSEEINNVIAFIKGGK